MIKISLQGLVPRSRVFTSQPLLQQHWKHSSIKPTNQARNQQQTNNNKLTSTTEMNNPTDKQQQTNINKQLKQTTQQITTNNNNKLTSTTETNNPTSNNNKQQQTNINKGNKQSNKLQQTTTNNNINKTPAKNCSPTRVPQKEVTLILGMTAQSSSLCVSPELNALCILCVMSTVMALPLCFYTVEISTQGNQYL